MVRDHRPALLLVERHLPGQDGLDVCRTLRAGADAFLDRVADRDRHDRGRPRRPARGDRAWRHRLAGRALLRPLRPHANSRLAPSPRVPVDSRSPAGRRGRPPPRPSRPPAPRHSARGAVRPAHATRPAPLRRPDRARELRRRAPAMVEVPARARGRRDPARGLVLRARDPRDRPLRRARRPARPPLRRQPGRDRAASRPLLRGVAGPGRQRAALGTLCIIDRRPRELAAEELHALRDLATLVEGELARAPATPPAGVRPDRDRPRQALPPRGPRALAPDARRSSDHTSRAMPSWLGSAPPLQRPPSMRIACTPAKAWER